MDIPPFFFQNFNLFLHFYGNLNFDLIGILVVHGWQVGNQLFVSFAQVPTLAKYLLVFSHLSLMNYIYFSLSFLHAIAVAGN